MADASKTFYALKDTKLCSIQLSKSTLNMLLGGGRLARGEPCRAKESWSFYCSSNNTVKSMQIVVEENLLPHGSDS